MDVSDEQIAAHLEQVEQIQKLQTQEVLIGVRDERVRQLEKWGPQEHTWGDWALILGEEYGEACQAALKILYGKQTGSNLERQWAHLRSELIQVAAVAVAAIEQIDREAS